MTVTEPPGNYTKKTEMAKTIDAAKKPNAGKKGGAKKRNAHKRITAEIGKVYLTMEKCNENEYEIALSIDCIDPDLNAVRKFKLTRMVKG